MGPGPRHEIGRAGRRTRGRFEDDPAARRPEPGPFQFRYHRHPVGVHVRDHLAGAASGQHANRLGQQFTPDGHVEQAAA